MGLLSEGKPLTWEETKKHVEHVKKHGVRQFVNLYRKLEMRCGDALKWGEEVEYNLIKFDPENEKVRLSLRAEKVLAVLQKPEEEGAKNLTSLWRPEYAAYMVEGTPGTPYLNAVEEFNGVEKSMIARRKEVQNLLEENEHVVSLSCFPRLGCPGFTVPETFPDPENSFTRSLFWPNEATFMGHPRFKTLSSNVRERRGRKVCINVPVFMDENTIDPFEAEKDILTGKGQEPQSMDAPKPGHVYMDAMGFGMGLSCLQVTFQACGLKEAENLYDQLAPLCPVLLAFSAATPFARGYLAEVDCRWDMIAASVDCRTKEELGEEPLKNNKFLIPKSRYDSISSYLSDCSTFHGYNDVELVHDPEVYQTLRSSGIKETMAKHVAHLFIRDTVSLFSEKIDQSDEETDHFENIQSTNWQTMRFKPPPPRSEIGWRVEFRPCELQFCDFENAAICSFVVLLTRVILSFKYNILIPISKVDENMKRAQRRDAILNEKFYFVRNITTSCTLKDSATSAPVVDEMTIDEIFNGKPETKFPGLIPIIEEYLQTIEVDTDTMCTLAQYWSYLSRKAKGELRTNARFMRDFVTNHPDYRRDSIVSEKMQYDLLKEVVALNENGSRPKRLVEVLSVLKVKDPAP